MAMFEDGPNSWFIEEQYKAYSSDPSLVDETWRSYFRSINGNGTQSSAGVSSALLLIAVKVSSLIDAYRRVGHTKARINPLTTTVIGAPSPELEPSFHGLSEDDLSIALPTFEGKSGKELIGEFERIYCQTIGFQYAHINRTAERKFLQDRIEATPRSFSKEERKYFLRMAIEAELFEQELHKKFVGQKRFSIEGGEGFLSMLVALFERAASGGVRDIILGTAHRGRLATLCNVLGKPLEKLFAEFEDTTWYAANGFGDVKYHLEAEFQYQTLHRHSVYARLLPNPSHLETVHAITEGVVRARQDILHQRDRKKVLPVVVHGDAAFAGQGVVYECLNFSQVSGYLTGGTIHIAINNQVGFTTTADEGRSNRYCSDGVLMIEAPVLHVNGEDIDACARAAEIAVEYRNQFGRDVVLDLYCYRKYGHNEGDDPTFTQPAIYEEIKKKTPVTHLYSEVLQREGVVTTEEVALMQSEYKAKFKAAAERGYQPKPIPFGEPFDAVVTATTEEKIRRVHDALMTYPDGFAPHLKLQKIIEKRTKAIFEDGGIEWGVAEALAFGTLLQDGVSLRLSGQDCGRGTFSHRHAALDSVDGKTTFYPLSQLSSQASFEVFNSTLSEYAVMGFEWGYSHIAANTLTMWEGQFGDFANGAQIIIDQYCSSAEKKWGTKSGLTLLLPHGFEGQGPEHSSARLERYLQLCGDGNLSVAYPSTAASYFHLMRRQGLRKVQRPLVVMTPKSLLRLPEAMSKLSEFTSGSFEPVLVHQMGSGSKPTATVLLSGKIYHEVVKALAGTKAKVKLLRLEELYPFPADTLQEHLKGVSNERLFFVQEEPRNQGAYPFVLQQMVEQLGVIPTYIGRPASPQTACGSAKRHAMEQAQILEEVKAAVSA